MNIPIAVNLEINEAYLGATEFSNFTEHYC